MSSTGETGRFWGNARGSIHDSIYLFVRMNLPKKLTHLIFILILITVSVVTYGSYRTIRFWALEQLRKNSVLEVQDKARQIDQWFSFYKTKAITIAQTPLVQTMNWERMEAYLEAEVNRLKPEANDATLCNPDGTYYFTGIGFVEGKTVADRPYFKAAMSGQEVVVSEPIISRASGVPKINIAVPVGDPASPIGVSTLGIKLDSIREIFNEKNDISDSYIFVLDSKGRAIVHPNPGLVFNQDQPEPKTLTEIAKETTDTTWMSVLQRMVARESGNELIQINGKRQYINYLPLEEVDWSIGLVTPQQHIDAQLRSLDVIALASGTSIIALLLTLWLLQTQFTKNAALQMLQSDTLAANQQLEAKTTALSQALMELKQAQSKLVQSEKMASIGQLVAGVAHEINNPLNFINGNLVHLQDYVDSILSFIQLYQKHYPEPTAEITTAAKEIDVKFLQHDLPKLVHSMEVGTHRIQKIVLSLKTFSQVNEAPCKTVNVHTGLDSTLLLLKHRLTGNKHFHIDVVRDYGAIPLIECYVGLLNQVFMNLLVNAIDALEEFYGVHTSSQGAKRNGQIQIRTSTTQAGFIKIEISDNGPGIPKDIRQHIFDPFFTTKPIGKGTGIGLSISYQIITERHGGKLDCVSKLNQGSTFIIQIPSKQDV